MVRTRGPAVSAEASGSLGRILTYSNWKGKQYAKHLSSTRKTETPIQVSCRQMVDYLTKAWTWKAKTYEDTWKEYGDTIDLDPYEAYLKYNLDRWSRYRAPTAFYPANVTLNPGDPATWVYDIALRTVDLGIYLGKVNDNWAAILYRSVTNGFEPGRDNAIHGYQCDTVGTYRWRDGPLPPGNYYYRLYTVGLGGKQKVWAQQLGIAIPG